MASSVAQRARLAAALARSFRSLQVREYRRWSLAQLLSGAGGAASAVAVAWLVVELGGDGVTLGVVTGCMMLPTLLLGSFAGAFVDRFSRRGVLLVTQSVQMLVAACFAVLVFTGMVTLPALIGLSLVQGLAFAVDNPARQLLVLDIVGRERVTSAVSMNEVVINGSRIVGPAIAGVLLVVGHTGWCFVMGALFFVPALIILVLLGRAGERTSGDAAPSSDADAANPTPHPATPARTWRSSWRYAFSTPAIRATLILAVGASASFNIAVVMPLMVSEVFRAGGGTYGAVAVAFGLGALPGALLSAAGPVDPRSGEVRTLALALAAAVVLAALAPTLPTLFAAMALVGATSMWFIARANAFVMLQTPAGIRGRVMGIWTMALPGSSVVTGLVVGALADALGPRVGYGVVGVCMAAVALIAWRGLRSS